MIRASKTAAESGATGAAVPSEGSHVVGVLARFGPMPIAATALPCRRGRRGAACYRIGASPAADFPVVVKGEDCGAFVLVRADRHGAHLHVVPRMRVRIQPRPDAPWRDIAVTRRQTIALLAGTRVEVVVGPACFEIDVAVAERRPRYGAGVDRRFWRYNTISAVCGAALLLGLLPARGAAGFDVQPEMSPKMMQAMLGPMTIDGVGRPPPPPAPVRGVNRRGGSGQMPAAGAGTRRGGLAEGPETPSADVAVLSPLYTLDEPGDGIPQMARNFDPDVEARQGLGGWGEARAPTNPYGGAASAGGGDGRGRPAVVKQRSLTVGPGLDRDIVRRIVRAHIGGIRACYGKGLADDPSLRGKVHLEFVVRADGRVSVAPSENTTLGDARVGQCVALAASRWRFPRPIPGEKSWVQVHVVFALRPPT